jgi:hypothetical protein
VAGAVKLWADAPLLFVVHHHHEMGRRWSIGADSSRHRVPLARPPVFDTHCWTMDDTIVVVGLSFCTTAARPESRPP